MPGRALKIRGAPTVADVFGEGLAGRVLALPEGRVRDYMALDGDPTGPVVLRAAGGAGGGAGRFADWGWVGDAWGAGLGSDGGGGAGEFYTTTNYVYSHDCSDSLFFFSNDHHFEKENISVI